MDGYWLSQEHAQDQADTLNAAYLAGQASQSSAAMSKDYERLYDHLLGGGEALGYTWSDPNDVRTRTAASISFVGGRFAQIEYIDDFGTVDAFETDEGALPFIAECQRLNL